MLAADSSSLVAYMQGDTGSDIEELDDALQNRILVLPPVVLTELFSDPKLHQEVKAILLRLPLFELKEDFFVRAGELRAQVLKRGRKARLGDALISQCCIDHRCKLITRDKDFANFAAVSPDFNFL
jgi:predicted nucleic acid-binding protein